MIDRAGRPKAAYEMLRRSYQPLLIAARFPWRRYAPGDIFGPRSGWSTSAEASPGCRAQASLDDTVVWTVTDLGLPPAPPRRWGAVRIHPGRRPAGAHARAALRRDALASNRYDWPLICRAVSHAARVIRVGGRLLELDRQIAGSAIFFTVRICHKSARLCESDA